MITQFITSDGTDSGDLVEIRRVYVQNNVVMPNPAVKDQGPVKAYDSITDGYCHDIKDYYNDVQVNTDELQFKLQMTYFTKLISS